MSKLKLPITVGTYRTRGGKTAVVSKISADERHPYPAVGSFPGCDMACWQLDGDYVGDGAVCDWDLVERLGDIPEPKPAVKDETKLKLPIWPGIYRTRSGALALITRTAEHPDEDGYQIFGSVLDGQEDEDSWNRTGNFNRSGKASDYDLVERIEFAPVLREALSNLENFQLEETGPGLADTVRRLSDLIETLKPLETRRPPL